jgi:hypothetical protein
MFACADHEDLDLLAQTVRATARSAFATYCPLYEALADAIADHRELLEIAATARPGQAPALLMLDTVHFLLLSDPRHPLAEFYVSLTPRPRPPAEAAPSFLDFCRANRKSLATLLPTRLVQTNEVRRCALLLPALGIVAAQAGPTPPALLVLGASAGLNMAFDRYAYAYSDGRQLGDAGSGLLLSCTLRGDRKPPLPEHLPAFQPRVGIDLNPLDVGNPDDVRWLLAQIWPNDGYAERAQRVRRAAELTRQTEHRILRGDITELLPQVVDPLPPGQSVCVLHSFTVYELPAPAKAKLKAVLAALGSKRPLFDVGLEWDSHKECWLDLAAHQPGRPVRADRLAHCQVHGEWLEWL